MSPLITAAFLFGALCWSTAAAPDSVQDGNGAPDLKLLFVGNSLLYYNGGAYKVVVGLLHDHFPNATIQADQVVGPNFLFTQHLQAAQTPGTAQYQTLAADSKDQWDAVIFQEESQQVALGGDANSKSLGALKQLAKLAAARGAKVGVDLTWAWLDGKNPDFSDYKQMQAKVNSGYAANLNDLIAADGIPAFIAPVGLGWQAVDELVDAARSGTPALVEAEQYDGSAPLTVLVQSAPAGQTALSLPAGSPLAGPIASLQSMSPTKQICQQSASLESALSPAQAPSPAAVESSTLAALHAAPLRPSAVVSTPAPTAQTRQTARAAQQLPLKLAAAPGARLPSTVASIQFVAGRRLQTAALRAAPGQHGLNRGAEALLPAAPAARGLLESQTVEAAAYLYGTAAAAPASSPASIPAAARTEVPAEAPAPGAATSAPAPASASAHARQAPGPEGMPDWATAAACVAAPSHAESLGGSRAAAPAPAAEREAAAPTSQASAPRRAAAFPAEGPADALNHARADLVEEEPTPEHESVTELRSAAGAPAPAEDASVEGSTGSLCSPGTLPAGTDTFTQMYASDGNHPSNAGTYLEGLIIASSITGCRMKGNSFTSGLEPKWYTFLQELSDAVVFEATPAQFPPYPWSGTGPKCALKP